jgi:hypothetical protein
MLVKDRPALAGYDAEPDHDEHHSTHSAAWHEKLCRCGQDVDLCTREHCPRCGAVLSTQF